MVVLVALAVTELLHQPCWRVADVQRNFLGAVFAHVVAGRVECGVGRIGFRRGGEIDGQLGECEFAFGAAQSIEGFPRIDRHLQGARIGEADVLHGHARQAARKIARVGAAIEHPRQPVQRRIRIRAAHAFVQRRDLVVELFAALVEAARAVGQYLFERRFGNRAALARQVGGDLEEGQATTHVAVGSGGDQVHEVVADLQFAVTEAALFEQCTPEGDRDVVRGYGFHHVHAASRQQRGIQLEGRILGGGADENDRAALDVRQERILLHLVEAMHLVNEQHGTASGGEALGGLGQHFPYLGETAEDRGNSLELGVRVLREQQGQRGLAAARRAPQDHRMHVAGLDALAQRGTGREQAALADHFVERARPHAFGERTQVVGVDAQQIG